MIKVTAAGKSSQVSPSTASPPNRSTSQFNSRQSKKAVW